MSFFSTRNLIIVACSFAACALAAPVIAAALDLSTVIARLNALSASLSTALLTLDGLQRGSITNAGTFATNVNAIARAGASLSSAVVSANLAKALAFGSARGTAAVADVNQITSQINLIGGQFQTLAAGLGSSPVLQVLGSDAAGNALIRSSVNSGLSTLANTVNGISILIGTNNGQASNSFGTLTGVVNSVINLINSLRVNAVVNAGAA